MKFPGVFNRSSFRNERGAALLTVFLVIMLLLTLGMGLMALTVGNVQQAKADDTYEKAYYVAEGGAQQGVEYVHREVLDVYNGIRSEMNSGISSSNNATTFFDRINTAITGSTTQFIPVLSDSTGAAAINTLSGSVSMTGTGATRTFTVASTAANGSISRKVVGSLSVTFTALTSTATYTSPGAQSVISGGTFDSSAGSVTISGGAKFNNYSYKKNNLTIDGIKYTGGALPANLIDTSLASSMKFPMKYPGFTPASPTAVSPPTLNRQIADGENITNATFKNPPYNWTVPSPIYLEGQPNASFTVDSALGTFNGGQINMSGALTDKANITGTSSSYVKIFCKTLSQTNGTLNYVKIYGTGDLSFGNGPLISNCYIYTNGNVSFSGRSLSNVTVICDGNLTINGGGESNLTIYCKGTVNDSSTSRDDVNVYCDQYYMSGGNISGDSIVLAKSYMSLESTINGLFYCGGNVALTNGGSGVTGQIAAIGNITTTGYSFTYDSVLMARLNASSFLTSSPANGSGSITMPLNSAIFTTPATFSEP